MGGVLTVKNDRLHDFELENANIFTPGQGICLQRLKPKSSATFKFDNGLAYGSWYDIQIIGRHRGFVSAETAHELQRYLKKGIYLSCKKKITVSKLISDENLDHGAEWQCGACKQKNIGSLALCEYCFENKSEGILTLFSIIPIVGIPFSVTRTILKYGKAAQTNTKADTTEAAFSVVFAVLDIGTSPFLVGSLVSVPGKVATENGIKLTAKTVFCEAGKPLLIAAGKELGKDGIVPLVTTAKIAIKVGMKNMNNENENIIKKKI